MVLCGRVAVSLVLVLTMLVSPLAPVLCALECPATVSTHAASTQRSPEAQAPSPCHDEPGPTLTSHRNRTATQALTVLATASHHCEHPAAVTSSSAPEVPRVPQPLVASVAAAHLSPRLAPTLATALNVSARAPMRRHVAGFGLALRI